MTVIEKDEKGAWLVCIGASLSFFLETGLIKALGVLLPVLRQQFATETWVIGLTISLLPGFGGVAGQLGGALNKKLSSHRIVCNFSFLSSLAIILASIATSVLMLSSCFIVSALAFGAEAILIAELAIYFHQNFGVANAISRSAISLGIIVTPLLTQLFLDVYGWGGTMLLLGALCFHQVLSGTLLRPIPTDQEYDLCEQGNDDCVKDEIERRVERPPSSRKLCGSFMYYFDLELFSNPILLTRLVFSFGNAYSFVGWMIYLVPFAMDTGLPSYRAAALSTIGGVGNILGNAVFPLSKKILSNESILYVTAVISTLALGVCPVFSFYQSYPGLIISTFIYGWSRGPAVIVHHQIAKDNIDKERMTNAFTWMFASFSFGSRFRITCQWLLVRLDLRSDRQLHNVVPYTGTCVTFVSGTSTVHGQQRKPKKFTILANLV